MATRRTLSKRASRPAAQARPQFAHQFLIVLANTDPLVWRRIQVPETYSFWDLHVAIQDAMGWEDSHLHEFTVLHPSTGRPVRFGIPDRDYPEERPLLPGWKARITEHFAEGLPPALYVYDFGDNWRHALVYEGTAPADPAVRYPRCLAGAQACPPEDCGGPHRYRECIEAIAEPEHPEHEASREWFGAPFDPSRFDPQAVAFDDPQERWRRAFDE